MTDSNSPGSARLCIHDITKSHNSAPVLTGTSLITESGETVAVMEPPGSGKSTPLHCISDVLLPDDGDVIFGDTKINPLSNADHSALHLRDSSFVFQSSQPLPGLITRENIVLSMILQGKKHSRSLELTGDVLSRLGLTDLMRRCPGQMSGGRMQRVAIACTMAGGPGVISTDEPTDALGQSTSHEVMQQLIASVKQTGAMLMMVTRDVKVADWCRRRVEIRDGLTHDDRMLAEAEVAE